MIVAVVLAAAAAVADPTGPDPVQFGTLRFDAGHNWTVTSRSPRMVLESTNATIKAAARITIEPAVPFEGTLEEAREGRWTAALAGRAVRGEVARDDPYPIEADGKVAGISAAVQPSGGLHVVVVQSGSFVTTLTFTADSDLAFGVGEALLLPVLFSLKVVPPEPPPGGTTAGPAGPGSLGPDPAASFDWNGPDRFDYGIYDHNCLEPDQEFGELTRMASDFVGAVQPRTVTYAAAMATLRKLLTEPSAKAQYDAANGFASKEHPKLYTAGAVTRVLVGDPFGALAHLLAGVDAVPDDPDVLFNLAAVLAEVGMPNESLAVLRRLEETRRKPSMAAGLSAEAALAYLAGYDEMLRGNLEAAKAKLLVTIQKEPFLHEAHRVLSLIQAHQGGGGAQTYLDGMWRFTPKQRVLCGTQGAMGSRRPPVDEMFDTSKGKPGRLPDFRHPRSADELPKLLAKLATIGTAAAESGRAFVDRYGQLRAQLPDDDVFTPYDVYADKMTMLIEGLDETEPLVLKLQEEADASGEQAREAVERAAVKVGKKALELAMSHGSKDFCPELRDYTTQVLGEARPYLVHWETKQRRSASTWYRIGTGLNSHLSGTWHDVNDASLRAQLETHAGLLVMTMSTAYDGIWSTTGGLLCLGDEQAEAFDFEPDQEPACPEGMAGLNFKYTFELPHPPGKRGVGPKLGFQVDCEKFTVEIEYDLVSVDGALVEFGLGGFAQLEMSRRGEYSLFAGAKVSGSAGGSGGSIKDGLWIKGRADGTITELGGKIAAETTLRTPHFSVNGPGDEMTFNLLPEPPKPKRWSGLRPFRGAIP